MAETAGAEALAERYRQVRRYCLQLIDGLSAEDCAAQAMPDASPQKWHLAHTSRFFDTFVLTATDAGYRSPNDHYRQLFNSYFQGIGPQHPRPQHGLLTRPSLTEILDWREQVDAAMLRAITHASSDPMVVELGLQHEQQHQELMRTDLLALIALNPLKPALCAGSGQPSQQRSDALAWLAVPGGVVRIGHAGEGFCFDNQLPAHDVILQPFEIASDLVTQRAYLDFIGDDGYRNPAHWLAEGWEWVQAGHRRCPQHWRHVHGLGWLRCGLDSERLIADAELDAPRRPPVVLRSRCVCTLGRRAAAHRAGMESGRAYMATCCRRCLAIAGNGLPALMPPNPDFVRSRVWPANTRQIHGEPASAARFIGAHAAGPSAHQLPEFLPRRRDLAAKQ